MLASLASSVDESVMSWKGFGRLGSYNTESCACSCYLYFKLVEDAIRKPLLTKQARKKKFCDFNLWKFSLVFKAILWGRAASIRHRVFIRGECLI